MNKPKVEIECKGVDVPYKKINKDVFLAVNGKAVRVRVDILQDEEDNEYETSIEISRSDTKNLTEAERRAVSKWCDTNEVLSLNM